MAQISRRNEKQGSRHWVPEWIVLLLPLLCVCKAQSGPLILTQTHPAAPYVCRTGNITLRCQYDGVERVTAFLWVIEDEATTGNPSMFTGHTVSSHTATYQYLTVNNYTNLGEMYRCTTVFMNGSQLSSNDFETQNEFEVVTISSLTLASRTATTLSVTWSAGYPKCYSFTVSHSTQDGSIPVTQPADSDTSHTLTSLQPGTTYRIEVEAVRKGEGGDGQRAKVMGNFTTNNSTDASSVSIPTSTSSASPPGSSTSSEIGAITGGVVGGVLTLVTISATVTGLMLVIVCRRILKPVAVIKTQFKAALEREEPPTREEEEGEKMQANPSYLPIEMSYKSQEEQYVNVKKTPPNVADVDEHAKLQANPSYVPIELNYTSQESKYINIPT